MVAAAVKKDAQKSYLFFLYIQKSGLFTSNKNRVDDKTICVTLQTVKQNYLNTAKLGYNEHYGAVNVCLL
jgi:hypothetical protein